MTSAPRGYTTDLTRQLHRARTLAGALDDARRQAMLDQLTALHAELVDVDPTAEAHYIAVRDEHTALMQRSQAIRDLQTSFAFPASADPDPLVRNRAQAVICSMQAVIDYLTERERQAVARSWQH